VNGNPAISYYDLTNQDLKYVRATTTSGTLVGDWGTPVTLDSTGDVGLYTSQAVVNGNPAISYYDQTNGDPKYVRATDASGTTWGTPVTLDSTGNVGQYPSLAVVNGNPAISYYDNTNTDLKYVRATTTSGTLVGNWGTPVTLDSTGSVGQYASQAVVNGNPAISYYDSTNGDLKWVAVVTSSAPTVASISPTSGSTAGGTSVTLTGTDFTGATSVTIGGAAATSVTVVNATTITAVTPAGSAGTASVVVTTSGGSNAANTLFTYAAPATPGETWTARDSNRNWAAITSSADGSKLAAVVKNGQIYTSTDSGVTWTARDSNRQWRSITSSSDGSKLAAVVQSGQIYTSIDSGATWTARDSDRYWFSITSSADGSKLAAVAEGGKIYTSTDSGLNWTARYSDRVWYSITSSADGSKLAAVAQGGQIYTSIDSGETWTARDSNRFWFSITSSADGSKLAAVAGGGGGKIYTSIDSGETWTAGAISQNWSAITSSADGSKLAAAAFFGNIYTSTDSGATWTARDSSRLWYSITSSADGSKLAAVVQNGQIYTSAPAATSPTVTSISPAAGTIAGGTSVTITGTRLTGATGVTIGGAAATSVTVVNATTITAVTPAGSAGTASVVVTTPDGSNAANTLYTYAALPTVTSITATAGPTAGGTTVTITGTNLTGATAVTFGATAASGFTVNSATQITATTPVGSAGTVDVRVTTVGGTSATSAADQFTFVAAPTVTSLSPNSGPAVGSASVTITGTNLSGASAVTFGTTAATGFTVNSATSITATAPAGSGTVNVRVTTEGGTSASSAADQFSYLSAAQSSASVALTHNQPSANFTAVTGGGGTGTLSYSVSPTLPTGLSLSTSTGAITGSPTVTSSATTYTVTVTDANSATASNTFSLTVNAAVTATQAVAFTTLVQNQAATSFTPVTGGSGTTPLNYSVSPTLPTGLNLSTSTGAITGTPTVTSAATTYTVTVTDTNNSTANNTFSLTINPGVSIAATVANAVEGSTTGEYTFTRTNSTGDMIVNFQLDASSTATAGTDFTLTSAQSLTFSAVSGAGTVVIPNGSATATLTLNALVEAPNAAEAAESARLNLTAGAGYAVNAPPADNATVTIAANSVLVMTTSDSGSGSLRQAVANTDALAGDDTIIFDSMIFGSSAQTITLSTGSLNVSGNGKAVIVAPAVGLTVSGGYADRVFMTTSGAADLTLDGVAIINGSPSGNGGGVYVNGGTVTLLEAVIAGNTASAGGGGIACASGSTVRVINSTISGNTAEGAATAGGIDSAGTLTVINSTISGNSVTTTDAGNAGGIKQAGTANLRSTTITNNSTGGSVGASGMLVSSGTVSVGNTLIAANVNNSTTADISGAFTSAGSNLIGNKGTAAGLTDGFDGDLVGNAMSVLDPKIGALANNGGTTPTHLLLSGSPAINAGNSILLPADIDDLNGDSNVAEALPVDQRGVGFPRIQGSTVDIGAVEGLVFTPTLTAVTTNEDVQSSTGLVITANPADAGGTTNYQITAITGGTLYKSNGTTAIANNDFITKAEGAAGLKFTPAANVFSLTTTFGFSVQASISAITSGLKDSVVPASITVNPVADTPLVTNTATTVNIQSVNGLVITRNAVDGPEIGFFKITNIQHGTLYQNNGTTVINAGDFITVAQGGAGLKFISALDYTGFASFDVQGSVDNTGTGLSSGMATASILVGTVDPTPTQSVPTDPVTGNPLPPGSPYPLISQTGTLEMRVVISNSTAAPLNGFRLSVDYSTYLAGMPSLRLYNSSSAPSVVPAFINYPFPVAVGNTVTLKLEFYSSSRRLPTGFNPPLTVTALAASEVSSTDGSGVQPRLKVRPSGTVLLEWDSIPGRWYRMKYSSDLTNWFNSPVPLQATANRMQWLDDGAPFTNVSPATVPARFYRLNEISAPTP
jgi:hypothetical protein